jgi:hypothetical protein
LTATSFAAISDSAVSSPRSIASVKDKVCVVSQNTGFAMWYNTENHGFSPITPEEGTGASSVSAESLIFGSDHQLQPCTFDGASVYNIERGASNLERFVDGSTKGMGAPIGLVFGKDASLYLVSATPKVEYKIIDSEGILVDATITSTRPKDVTLKVIQLPAPVPEPNTFALLGAAGAALLAFRRRK